MPLRDHFRPPLSTIEPWDALHGQWPAVIVMDLNNRLPPEYVARPQIHLGVDFEIDVATSARARQLPSVTDEISSGGGLATAIWAPPQPTLAVETDLPDLDEYEVRIVETQRGRLVAAVEIVSPANKDRPESRRAFAAKCETLLQQGVSVTIIDLVTAGGSNLYGELMDLIGQGDPWLSPAPPGLYAVSCRWRHGVARGDRRGRLESWAHTLSVGEALPQLPLWLSTDLAVPLELEATYEQTCRALRIP